MFIDESKEWADDSNVTTPNKSLAFLNQSSLEKTPIVQLETRTNDKMQQPSSQSDSDSHPSQSQHAADDFAEDPFSNGSQSQLLQKLFPAVSFLVLF